jgi:hypothetical protein
MNRILKAASMAFLALAAAAVLALIFFDLFHRGELSAGHKAAAAAALMMIGLSYVCIHLGARPPGHELWKAVLLGSAFVVWGLEQFVAPSVVVTFIDTVVVSIFVADLGASVLKRQTTKR